eukprot:890610-Prorocentrum_minimum.AAC.3
MRGLDLHLHARQSSAFAEYIRNIPRLDPDWRGGGAPARAGPLRGPDKAVPGYARGRAGTHQLLCGGEVLSAVAERDVREPEGGEAVRNRARPRVQPHLRLLRGGALPPGAKTINVNK